MYYEDVRVERGETVSQLAGDYGYKVSDWEKVWKEPRNASLVARRRVPESLQAGDTLYVPIPWVITSKSVTATPNGSHMAAERNGELGKRMSWVQTVYQHNQAITGTTTFCVDGCPAVGDFADDEPFYFTAKHFTSDPNWRKKFSDYPSRNPPSAVEGTTKWRAIVSLAVITLKRVTVYDSLVWGFNMTPANIITTVGPRAATGQEVAGHLNLLRKGKGTGPLSFGKTGWAFRTPP